MSGPVIKYDTPPALSISYPDCNACAVEVESDGDCWNCPRCGTSWSYNAGDGDTGELYEEWAGEENPGELRDIDDGYRLTSAEMDDRAKDPYGMGKLAATLVATLAPSKEDT